MITLVADVPDGPGPTLYTRIGDVFAWFSIAASLLMAAAVLGRKSRASGNCLNLKLGVQDKVGYS